jgi:hypothetical protein
MKQYKVAKTSGGWAVATIADDEIVTRVYQDRNVAAEACKTCETAEYFPGRKLKVWIVAETFVTEADLGGKMLGEIGHLDMSQYQVVERLSRGEIDKLRDEFFEENGHWPDE